MDAKIANALQESGISLTDIATELGFSKTKLSLILEGKYGKESEREKLKKEYENYVLQKASENIRFEPKAQQILSIYLKLAYKSKKMAMVTGRSGYGKTFAIKKFLQQHQDTLYIKIQKRMGYTGIIDTLSTQLGIPNYGVASSRLQKLITEMKIMQIKLVVADEADLLVGRRANKDMILDKIEVFREIAENGIGVLLVGLPVLEDAVMRTGETYVLRRFKYKGKLPAITDSELATFVTDVLKYKEISEKDLLLLIQQAKHRGYFGFLKNVVETARMEGSLKAALELVF